MRVGLHASVRSVSASLRAVKRCCVSSALSFRHEALLKRLVPISLAIKRSSIRHDVIMSMYWELEVLDVLDTAAGLRIHDVRALADPATGPACRDHVQADLSALRLRMGSDIVQRERQALPRLGAALLLHLAGEHRQRHLGLQRRTELVPAQAAIALDHPFHKQITGTRA